MGDRERMWEHTKAERRKEYLKVLREFQSKQIKEKFIADAKQVIFNQEQKLKQIDLTEAEVQECNNLIENANNIILKHKNR